MNGFSIWHWLVVLAALPVVWLFSPAGVLLLVGWRGTRRERRR